MVPLIFLCLVGVSMGSAIGQFPGGGIFRPWTPGPFGLNPGPFPNFGLLNQQVQWQRLLEQAALLNQENSVVGDRFYRSVEEVAPAAPPSASVVPKVSVAQHAEASIAPPSPVSVRASQVEPLEPVKESQILKRFINFNRYPFNPYPYEQGYNQFQGPYNNRPYQQHYNPQQGFHFDSFKREVEQ